MKILKIGKHDSETNNASKSIACAKQLKKSLKGEQIQT